MRGVHSSLLLATLAGTTVHACVAAAALRASAAESDAAVLERLEDQWAVQRDSIQTADLHLGLFQLMGGDAKRFGVKNVEAFCEQLAQVLAAGEGAKGVQRVTEALSLPSNLEKWVDMRVVLAGDRQKNVRARRGKPDLIDYDGAFDGKHSVWKRADIKQVDVYAGQMPIWLPRKDEMLFVPRPGLTTMLHLLPSPSRDVVAASGKSTSGQTFSLEADRRTGFVYRYSQAGKVEIFQLSPKEHETNVIFPTVFAKITIQGGAPHLTHIYYVKSAAFNHFIPDEAFFVDVAAGSTMVDYRTDVKKTYTAFKDHPNAVEALDEIIKQRSRMRRDQVAINEESQPRFSLIALNCGVILVVVSLMVFRRLRRSA